MSEERPRLAPEGAEERYEVVELLGQGGEGKVWRARDRAMRRDVAIKTLHRKSPEARAEFLEEAQVTGQLDHPNIVPIHEIGVDVDGAPYLVMRLVRGRRLSDGLAELRGAPLGTAALGRLLRVFRDMCLAVDFAHARGVVHRDLKPGNVMIGEFGEVLVLDWGLAKVLRGGAEERHVSTIAGEPGGPADTVRGVVKGTVAYMAPEQAAGRPGEIDARTDVYSLGCVLYEILAGHAPFEGPTESAISAILEGRVVRPSERAPEREVPPELEAIARKAMALSKADRYPSARDLRAEVESWLDGRIVAAHRYTLLGRAQKWVARHRALSGAIALAIAAAVGIPPGLDALAERTRRQAREEAEALEQARAAEQQARRAALVAEANAAIARIDDAAQSLTTTADAAKAAEEAFDRYAPLAREPGLEGALPLAEIALRRARLALVKAMPESTAGAGGAGGPGTGAAAAAPAPAPAETREAREAREAQEKLGLASKWAANAYAAEPRSEGAGRALLLLARETARRGRAREALDQFHLALSAFGGEHPALRPEALVGMTRALAELGPETRAPFDAAVPAREAALQMLLQVVDTRGALRPEVARALGAEQAREVGAEAHDLLAVLRRIAYPAFADGVPGSFMDQDGDGTFDALWHLDLQTQQLRVRRIGPPRAIGGPCVLDVEIPYDWSEALRALGPMAGEVYLTQVRLEGGSAAVLTLPDYRRAVLAPIERPSVLLDERHAEPAVGQLAGDLDGDGRTDLVVPFGIGGRDIRVNMRRADGTFAPSVPLRVLPASAPEADRREVENGSECVATLVADLDGDGRLEIAVSLGSWNHYSVEVWRVGAGGAHELLARRRTGRAQMCLLDGPQDGASTAGAGGRTLLVSTALGQQERRFFDLRDEEPPTLGVHALRFTGRELLRAPERDPGVERGNYTWIAAVPVGGRRAVFASVGGHTTVRFLEGEGGPRTLTLEGGRIGARPDFWHRGRSFRDATEEELDLLARRPPPAGLVPGPTPSEARTAVFLARFGLPDQAASAARVALAGPLSPEARAPLARTLLQSLAASGKDRQVATAIQTLAPEEALAPEAITAAEIIAMRLGRYGEAARVLEKWAGDPMIHPQTRALLAARAATWRRTEALLEGTPAVAWDLRSGVRARRASGAGSLQERILCGDASLALWPEGPVLRIRQQQQLDEPDVRAGPGGVDLSRGQHASRRFLGVPVRFRGGPWRITTDVALDDVRWSGAISAGLTPVRLAWHPVGPQTISAGFVARRFGGNGIDRIDISGRPWVPFGPCVKADGLLGRKLRIDVRSPVGGPEVRISVWDAETREPLGEEVSAHEVLPADLYVLGIAPEPYHEAAEGRIFSVAMWGDVEVVREDDAEVKALRAAMPALDAHTRAARALLRRDRDGAARDLEALAGVYEDMAAPGNAGPGAGPSPGVRARLARTAMRARIDAALARCGDDETRLSGELAQLARDEAAVEVLVERAVLSPQGAPGTRALQRAVGGAIAALRAPGSDTASMRAALEARMARVPTPTSDEEIVRADDDVLLAAWLDAEPGAPALLTRALVRALPSGRYDLATPALEAWLIALAPSGPDAGAPSPSTPAKLALARALDGGLRRAEAIALLKSTSDLPRKARLALKLHEELHADAEARAREARARHADREPVWPAVEE